MQAMVLARGKIVEEMPRVLMCAQEIDGGKKKNIKQAHVTAPNKTLSNTANLYIPAKNTEGNAIGT